MDSFTKFGTELVVCMAKALVDHPEQVSVEIQQGEHTTVFNLSVAPGDIGHVLGKQGANAASMRKILQGYAAKMKRRAILEILDPAPGRAMTPKAA